MPNLVYDQIKALNSASDTAAINAVLETIAVSSPGPIELDLFLKAVATQLDLGIKPVRQSYEMILKKLSILPVDIGLAIAQELLDTRYGGGTSLKLTQDGFLYALPFRLPCANGNKLCPSRIPLIPLITYTGVTDRVRDNQSCRYVYEGFLVLTRFRNHHQLYP